LHQVGKLTHNYQRVSVSDPANNERRNENEPSPFRTNTRRQTTGQFCYSMEPQERRDKTNDYEVPQSPSSEIVDVSLFKPFLYFGKYNASK
jgi:hypothetical protein